MSNGSEGSVYRPVVLAPWNLQSRLASPQPLCWLLWSTQERALCDVTIVFGAAALSASLTCLCRQGVATRSMMRRPYDSISQRIAGASRPTHAQPFILEAAQLSPRAHPHVCRMQP